MFTRLLLSIVATGLAPRSFYRLDADGNRQRAHYDGLPADFTADAVTTLGAGATTGYHTYNVLNTHDDGISLDLIVDWLIESGRTSSGSTTTTNGCADSGRRSNRCRRGSGGTPSSRC